LTVSDAFAGADAFSANFRHQSILSDKQIDEVAAGIINTGCDRNINPYERE
jgi:hypothetical protein